MSSITKVLARKEILIGIGSFSFVLGIINYFLPATGSISRTTVPFVYPAGNEIAKWNTAIMYMGIISGGILLVKNGITQIRKMTAGVWPFYVAQIAFLFFVLAVAFAQAPRGPWYILLALTLFAPVAAAAKAIQGFYGLSASYRAFRGRSIRTYIALAVTMLIVLRMTQLGEALLGTGGAYVADWLTNQLQAAVYRAFTMALAFGGIFTGVRFLLGRELRVFGRGAEERQVAA